MISGTTETINLIENKGSCDIKAVYGYNTQQAGYDTDAGTGKYYKTEKIEKGKGYWVYAKDDCALTDSRLVVLSNVIGASVFNSNKELLGTIKEDGLFIINLEQGTHKLIIEYPGYISTEIEADVVKSRTLYTGAILKQSVGYAMKNIIQTNNADDFKIVISTKPDQSDRDAADKIANKLGINK